MKNQRSLLVVGSKWKAQIDNATIGTTVLDKGDIVEVVSVHEDVVLVEINKNEYYIMKDQFLWCFKCLTKIKKPKEIIKEHLNWKLIKPFDYVVLKGLEIDSVVMIIGQDDDFNEVTFQFNGKLCFMSRFIFLFHFEPIEVEETKTVHIDFLNGNYYAWEDVPTERVWGFPITITKKQYELMKLCQFNANRTNNRGTNLGIAEAFIESMDSMYNIIQENTKGDTKNVRRLLEKF